MQIQTLNNKVSDLRSDQQGHQGHQDTITESNFPYAHLMFAPLDDFPKLLRHCKEVFQAVNFNSKFVGLYSNVLDIRIQQLSACLEESKNMWTHQKTLFIDLDETLILRSLLPHPSTTTLTINDPNSSLSQIHFKTRPHAFQFLRNMSIYYDLVLFTAAEESYAKAFFNYFNERTGSVIKDYLCRDYCIQAYKSVFFKDIRVVGGRELKDMILLDNSAYSFGSLVDNGVPIISYDGSEGDTELLYIQGYLREASEVHDVRDFNRDRLKLSQMVQVK